MKYGVQTFINQNRLSGKFANYTNAIGITAVAFVSCKYKKAVLSQGKRAMSQVAAVRWSVKFADIHYKF